MKRLIFIIFSDKKRIKACFAFILLFQYWILHSYLEQPLLALILIFLIRHIHLADVSSFHDPMLGVIGCMY
mgnify:CR=1 FL=1